jgi:hypothetical protein
MYKETILTTPDSSARAGAIDIQGAGTVIRNCVIETDGSTALWLFGPNANIRRTLMQAGRVFPSRRPIRCKVFCRRSPVCLVYGGGPSFGELLMLDRLLPLRERHKAG